uniref:SLAIN motif family member 1 n=1 Tax=Neogobius melanostomus TaxID=47308 RepID=A0A8C6SS66_9GOBI
MARMQEDSLRQELSLPPRRSHSLGSFPCPTAGVHTGREEEEEEEEEDYSDDEDYALPLLPPAPPLARLSHSHTFHALSSLSHWPSGAPQHPSATAGFAFHTSAPLELGSPLGDRGYGQGSDKLRRSLVRAPSMPSVPLPRSPGTSPRASPCVLRSQSFDLSSGLAFLQSSIPAPGPLQSRVRSMGSFSSASRPAAKATAYVSPTVKSPAYLSPSSSPLGSSGIPLLGKHVSPRPASFIGVASSTPRSKVAQPGRSFLTPPKSLSTLSALRDLAWRDGCY